MTLRSISTVLALIIGVTVTPGCGPKKVEPEVTVDESTITDPLFFAKRGVTKLQAATPDYQGAYTDFERATTLDPNNAKIQYNAGWTAERLGNKSNAEKHYRAALATKADYTSALVNLATILGADKRYDEAITLYKTYLAAKPDDLEIKNSLAETYNRAGRFDDAIAEAQSVLQKNPEDVAAYRNLSRAYFDKGELAMSQLCAEKAKTLNEGDPGIYNNIGVTYLQQGNLPAAIDAFKTAIRLDADHVEANLNLGYVALNSGDYIQAKTCFSAVSTSNPENVDALLGLAVALRGTKELEESNKVYERIMALDPTNDLVYFNAATLHEKYTKDYKAALKMLEQYKTVNEGKIGPNHEVFARMERVKQSQIEEDKRVAEAAAKAKAAEDRKKAQMAQLEELKKRVAGFNQKLTAASCPAVAEMGMLEDFKMVVEQAETVITSEEFSMAGDMITFIDSMEPTLAELIPMCGDAGGAPAPAPAPAPETRPAPAPAPQ